MKKIVLIFFILMPLTVLSQSRNSAKTKQFNRPLNFDVVGHGLEMESIYLHYDLESSHGDELVMGNIRISPETVLVNLLPASRLDSRLTHILPPEKLNDWVFLFDWPENLIQEGTLEAISRTGRVLWSSKIGPRELAAWREQLAIWREALLKAKIGADEIYHSPLFRYQFGLRQIDSLNSPFWDVQEPFRFCYSRVTDSGQTRLCTAQLEVIQNKNQIRLGFFPIADAPPRVIVKNEIGKLADEAEAPVGTPVQFYAELKSGMSFEFAASAKATHVVDMVQDRTGEFAWITTESELAPLRASTLLNKEQSPEWVEWVGWQQTIGDFRKYWRTRLSTKDTFLMVPGEGGGVFKQKFKIGKLPTESQRLYVDEKTIKGTYIDGAPIFGRKPTQVSLSTTENSVEVSPDKENFTWKFGIRKEDDFNRSYLQVQDGEGSFRAYHELYKGYNREISTRLSGILGAENDWMRPKILVMGELAFNYWFENLFGWNNSSVRQHWGASFKAFQTLTNLELSTFNAPLSSYTAELKYRFKPGLWARDETWGLLGGYQKVTYDFFDSQMGGVGFFWARSMPMVFDNLISWADWFNLFKYPKWVDLEFIYYVSALDGKTQMNTTGIGNWALNFHGQILFTKRFFGEAGFGIKQYDFSQTNVDRRNRIISKGLSFTSSYGTIGCGFKF